MTKEDKDVFKEEVRNMVYTAKSNKVDNFMKDNKLVLLSNDSYPLLIGSHELLGNASLAITNRSEHIKYIRDYLNVFIDKLDDIIGQS